MNHKHLTRTTPLTPEGIIAAAGTRNHWKSSIYLKQIRRGAFCRLHLNTKRPSLKWLYPVSYTHLDEYKRQFKKTIKLFRNKIKEEKGDQCKFLCYIK